MKKKKKWKEINNKYDIGERGNHNLEGAKLPASHLQFKHTLLTPPPSPLYSRNAKETIW